MYLTSVTFMYSVPPPFFPFSVDVGLNETTYGLPLGGHLCWAAISCVWLFVTLWALCPWDSPGKTTGEGCHFLLQGIFLDHGTMSSPLAGGFFTTGSPGGDTILEYKIRQWRWTVPFYSVDTQHLYFLSLHLLSPCPSVNNFCLNCYWYSVSRCSKN